MHVQATESKGLPISVNSSSPKADSLSSLPLSCSSWKDQWGFLHPGTMDLSLNISLYKTPAFFDVWDLSDGYVLFVAVTDSAAQQVHRDSRPTELITSRVEQMGECRALP